MHRGAKRRIKFNWVLTKPWDGKPAYMCAQLGDQFRRSNTEEVDIEVRRYPASITTTIKIFDTTAYYGGKDFFKIETRRSPKLDAPLEAQVYKTWHKILLEKIFVIRANGEIDASLAEFSSSGLWKHKEQPKPKEERKFYSPTLEPETYRDRSIFPGYVNFTHDQLANEARRITEEFRRTLYEATPIPDREQEGNNLPEYRIAEQIHGITGDARLAQQALDGMIDNRTATLEAMGRQPLQDQMTVGERMRRGLGPPPEPIWLVNPIIDEASRLTEAHINGIRQRQRGPREGRAEFLTVDLWPDFAAPEPPPLNVDELEDPDG